jgi:phosphopantetheinyl transferase (holo-ACP synthase)
MGSFEENYGNDVLRTFFTEEERTQLQTLHQRLDDIFDEIAAFLAKELGYGEADP